MQRWIAQAATTAAMSLGVVGIWMGNRAGAEEPKLPREAEEKFRQADANGDGVVDASEYPYGDELFQYMDRDESQTLNRAELRRYLVLQKLRKGDKGKKARERFAQADKDSDGVISRDEFPAADDLFQRFDRDGDGQITLHEAQAYAVEEEVAKIFGEHDQDLSGTLSRDEIPDSGKGGFALADVDSDGQLTGEEALAFFMELAEAPAPNPGMLRSKGDAPSGALDASTAHKLGVIGSLTQAFPKLDQDQDGSLSPDEFSGSRALFACLDVDGSGGVTPSEIELRIRYAKRLGVRGQELRTMAKQAGAETWLAVVAVEVKALFEAGRYEEVQGLMDELELRLLRRSGQK